MTPRRVLVAGIGNVFLGDDAFGVEVARGFAGVALPDGVEVLDIGIRGVHLAFELLDGCDLLVLVDTVARGQPPGTLSLIEPDFPGGAEPGPDAPADPPLDPHRLEPAALLAAARAMGAAPRRTLLLGCEPASLAEGMGLSYEVEVAVDRAVDAVWRLVRQPIDAIDPIDPIDEKGCDTDAEDIAAPDPRRAARRGGVEPAPGDRALPPDPSDVTARVGAPLLGGG
jgi:hydrogenase maturation protease